MAASGRLADDDVLHHVGVRSCTSACIVACFCVRCKRTGKGNIVIESNGIVSYMPIFQSNPLNGIVNLSTKRVRRIVDNYVSSGKMDFGIPIRQRRVDKVRYWILPGKVNLSGRTKQIYDLVIQHFTEKVPLNASEDIIKANKYIYLDLNEVAYLLNISVRAARDLVVDTLVAMTRLQIERLDIAAKDRVNVPEDIKGRIFPAVQEIVLQDGNKLIKNSKIIVALHDRLIEYLPTTKMMYQNQNLYSIDCGTYSNAYEFGKKMLIHYNTNFNKKNRIIIGVLTLLECAQEIPSRDEVMGKGKHVFQRVIKPFLRDMNYLISKNILSDWYFVEKGTQNKVNIDFKFLNKDTYDSFVNCNIYFDLCDYPVKQVSVFNSSDFEESIDETLDYPECFCQ